jgi:glycosyltransferase involved in cell wall biosynthesis
MIKPKVTIVVPVYNTEKYLKDCLDSLINQTYKQIEIICVNDGSTDNSGLILKKYAQKDHRIKIFNQKNQGPSAARNKGIKESNGEYIEFVDSDDQLDRKAVEELLKITEKNSLDMLLFNLKPKLTSIQSKKQYENLKNYYKRSRHYNKIVTGEEMFTEMVRMRDYLASPVLYLVKKEVLEKHGIEFFNGIIHEDNLFTLELLLRAKKVLHLNKELYIRLVRENSIVTKPISTENLEGYFICIREILKLASQLNLTKNTSEVLSDYLVSSLQGNLVKYSQQLQSSEVNTYKSKLSIEDRILFDLLTQTIVKEREKHRIHNMHKNLLQYKNTRFNRYSFKLGSKILYFPRKIYKLMKKLGILNIIKSLYKKTVSVFNNISDFFYAEFNPTYRNFMKFYKNREMYPIDYDTILVFPKGDISVNQSIQNVREITNDYSSKIFVCQTKNVNDINILSCEINLPRRKKHTYNKRCLKYFNTSKSHTREIKNIKNPSIPTNNLTKIQDPLISIVMPVLNQEELLEETIADILKQSLKNFELICIDDGSDDKTTDILISLAKNDNRIRVITKSRENAGATRNLGLIFARGKYTFFLDSDDRFDKDLLKKMYNKMDETNADICVCDADGFNTQTGKICYERFLFTERLPEKEVFNRKLIKENLFLFCTPCPWNKIFKTSFLKENNIFFQNLIRTNDLLFVFHSFSQAEKITTLNEKLVHYRVGTKTNLQSGIDKTPFALLRALLKLKDILEEEGLFKEYTEQSFVNVATTHLTYILKAMNKKENIRIVKYWLKKHGLKNLHIHGHSRDYFLYGHEKVLEKYCRIKFNKT